MRLPHLKPPHFIGRNWARNEVLPTLSAPAVTGKAEIILSEHDAKMLLKNFGLPVPEGRVCKTTEAASVAKRTWLPGHHQDFIFSHRPQNRGGRRGPQHQNR